MLIVRAWLDDKWNSIFVYFFFPSFVCHQLSRSKNRNARRFVQYIRFVLYTRHYNIRYYRGAYTYLSFRAGSNYVITSFSGERGFRKTTLVLCLKFNINIFVCINAKGYYKLEIVKFVYPDMRQLHCRLYIYTVILL